MRGVIGSGTVLDTARLKYLLGRRLGVDPRGVHAFIIGEHGDSELAVWSSANISGVDLSEFCSAGGMKLTAEELDTLYREVRDSAYEIIESSLNLKDVRIFDYQYDTDGRRVAVLNKKETAIAQGKQELLKEAFAEWIWKDPERREKICKAYNILFNSNRPREYDGSHISFQA